ncbi:DISARM system helicase DrmA [Rhodococcus sp. (in: high G+C Gram-positive bacteria)]|uniref:DISARM system helicase DrmA n=1 Tax=Rhodococcus sp. TaxID=1831 RepID=UPI0033156238
MTQATDTAADVQQYQLTHDPDGTSFTVRENLVDIIERELLGPAGGPDEILSISPRAQYLVGHIAPVKLTGGRVNLADVEDGDQLASIRDDITTHGRGRGISVEAPDDNSADSEDDDVDDKTPKQGLMLPASMGLRFQVPSDLTDFTVAASWGQYQPVDSERTRKDGRPLSDYKRTPIGISETIRIDQLTPGRTYTRELRGTVCLRVDIYHDPRFNRAIIEIALCNDRETPQSIPVAEWLFQTKLHITSASGAIFLPVRDVLEQDWDEFDDEVRALDLQYRDRLEFAVGRTCSVSWDAAKNSRRASAVWTTWLPIAETPQTTARSVEGPPLAMDELATASPERINALIGPVVDGYENWLIEQAKIATTLPAHLQETADDVLALAGRARDRLRDGLTHVLSDRDALDCFRFMNEVMRDQRVYSQIAATRTTDPDLSIEQAKAQVLGEDPAAAASWRPFQLAFILMQLGALTDPTAPARSGDLAKVELLFFPTGGGKTEAYLGLAAYTFAIRRRQGIIDTPDGKLDGGDGIAVLMRYTLRLLTSQQFQRATALVCAAELVRQRDPHMWGEVPFRIGLWVGTDVSPKRFDEAEEQLRKANSYGSGFRLSVLQVQRCPWCGTEIKAENITAVKATRRIHVHCGGWKIKCPFSKLGDITEYPGLPMLTVDEEIYRLTPAFVIATVDKFARLAREGEAASLFGYVRNRCGRHGYVHPDYTGCTISTRHQAEGKYPVATVRPVERLRPPDLIIQDELHLITGALGTAVGLFEVAVETLSSWTSAAGKPVKPMIVASTATMRNAADQVRGLYGRGVAIFPPQVLDASDTFFSKDVEVDEKNPGRRYIGISAQGVRLSSAEIRIAEVLLSSGQLLLDTSGEAADPYMTLVGYFNATRELAGMARYMTDDVQDKVRSPRQGSGFPKRRMTRDGLIQRELTSRISSTEIGQTLDQMSVQFTPELHSTAAVHERARLFNEGKKPSAVGTYPFDVVLATSMLQVGVDVQRLGLMLIVGQPKNTAEYIQASSRVGRDQRERPGLVVALGNWARPRDLAHFEQFQHYHNTFYAQVEALSVTPYSATSMERGLDGVLVSAARVLRAHENDSLSLEENAWKIENDAEADAVSQLIDRLLVRIGLASQDEKATDRARQRLHNRLDQWKKRNEFADSMKKTLVYEKTSGTDKKLALLMSPENVQAMAGSTHRPPFVIANSMREVQPEINVLVSPLAERMFAIESKSAPKWDMPTDVEEN